MLYGGKINDKVQSGTEDISREELPESSSFMFSRYDFSFNFYFCSVRNVS